MYVDATKLDFRISYRKDVSKNCSNFEVGMKKTLSLLTLLFCAALAAPAQSAEWKSVFSEEFYFWAQFPDEPKYSESAVDTAFGKCRSRRWTLETADGVVYEVSVDDFADLSVEMNAKSLNEFYAAVFADVAAAPYGVPAARVGIPYEMFSEYGVKIGNRGRGVLVEAQMFLARRRLYTTKYVGPASLESDRQKWSDLRKFFDEFLFIHRVENENRFRYGLPESASQHFRSR
jgi:hypothetical protein